MVRGRVRVRARARVRVRARARVRARVRVRRLVVHALQARRRIEPLPRARLVGTGG